MAKRNLHIIFLLVIFTILAGCEDRYTSFIPQYPVFLELNLTTSHPTFIDNGYATLTFIEKRFEYDRLGYGGILVICGMSSTNTTDPYQYYAYDLSCPHEADRNIRVVPNESGQAICEECGSVYEIGFGTGVPVEGDSNERLKSYRCSLRREHNAVKLVVTYQ